jgi:hypothetical protein
MVEAPARDEIQAACQWSPGRACQFSKHTDSFIEYEGRTFCPLHLPLGSEKKGDAGSFSQQFLRLQQAGCLDFTGTSFPGEPNFDSSPQYSVHHDLSLRNCTFGERATVAVGAASCDLSCSRFLGSSTLVISSGDRNIVCEAGEFLGNFRLEASSQNGTIRFTSSDFRAASRFNFVDQLQALDFAKCTFSEAPTFGSSQKIPQKTNFLGATFSLRPEDESAFRVLRNFYATHRARDSEGRFYAYEKRCHRLGMKGPGEWVSRGISFLYDATSEYGSSYIRALVWFCVIQVVSAITYAAMSGRLENIGGPYDSRVVAFTFAQVAKPFELFSSKASTDGFYSIVQRDAAGWWLMLTAVQSVISISLIALFLLALRWRFRRE